MCSIPWYSILCVLFANVPRAITHFLLMPIKMVITVLIICVGGREREREKRSSAGVQSHLADVGKQHISVWTNIWPITALSPKLNAKRVENVMHNYLLKKIWLFEWQLQCLMCNSWEKFLVDEELEAWQLMSLEDKNTAFFSFNDYLFNFIQLVPQIMRTFQKFSELFFFFSVVL